MRSLPPREAVRPNFSGYLSTDTIASLATGMGGALSVFRVSGPETRPILKKLTGKAWDTESRAPRTAYLEKIRNSEGGLIDEGLVTFFKAPHSFTGEDVAEFALHGGTPVALEFLAAVAEYGARQALAGEFSFRAVRNGKMSLTQAEAVADLIASQNREAKTLAHEKLRGGLTEALARTAEELRQIGALGELGIDFSDQDVAEVSLNRLKERLKIVREYLEKFSQSYGRGRRIQSGVRASFVGLPNAGKSSFFNSLLGEDRSIVSDIAGTTRDLVRETLTLETADGSVTLRLEDTAGLRDATDAIEKVGVERSRRSAADADLVVWVVDGVKFLSGSDSERAEILAEWKRMGMPSDKTVGVLTKTDLLKEFNESKVRPTLATVFGVSDWAFVSSLTLDGVEEATTCIVKACQKWVFRAPGEMLLTREEHVRACEAGLVRIDAALQVSEIDLFASDVRQALHALGPLIGETPTDDLLGRIFSQFCIGK